jgi:hypothetical protein
MKLVSVRHFSNYSTAEFFICYHSAIRKVVLGGAVASVLAIGQKVRGFKLGRGRCIFKGDNYKILRSMNKDSL